MGRRSVALLAVMLLAVMLVGAGCGEQAGGAAKPPPPREIDVLVMAPTEARVTGEYLGSMLSRSSVTVLPQVAGYVRKLHVKPGQAVAAGAALVEIDAREEGAALASATANAESSAARLALATQERARAEELFQQGVASAQERDTRRADEVAAQAAVRAARAQVSQRQVELGNQIVRAPVPGVIADVQVRLGDYVTATTRLTAIAGGRELELTVAVPASRARSLAADTPIELLGDDGAVVASSRAFYVAPEADPRTQLVAIKAAFANELGFRPAELVRARVVYAVGAALQVPALAVVRQSGQAFVFVVAMRAGKQVVERRQVALGALGANGFVIERGLAAGDQVAVSGIQQLRDGAAVTIKAPKPAAAAGSPAPPAPASPPPASPPPASPATAAPPSASPATPAGPAAAGR